MDGEPPQEEDFSQIPIIERSQHKVSCLTCWADCKHGAGHG